MRKSPDPSRQTRTYRLVSHSQTAFLWGGGRKTPEKNRKSGLAEPSLAQWVPSLGMFMFILYRKHSTNNPVYVLYVYTT